MNDLVDGLGRGTFESFAIIRHNVDQLLMEISNRLKEIFDREAAALQKGVCDAMFKMVVSMKKERLLTHSLPTLRSLVDVSR